MQKTTRFCFAVLALSAAVCTQAARPVEFTVGTEYYKENYREYKDGERLMRQKGNLWSLTGGVKYRFNDRHAAKIRRTLLPRQVGLHRKVSGRKRQCNGIRHCHVQRLSAPRL